jgi:hypothetical protein
MTPLDRIISIIREDVTTANAPGEGGGFGGSSPDPRAGYDTIMGMNLTRRGKIDRRNTKNYKKKYNSWLKSLGLL